MLTILQCYDMVGLIGVNIMEDSLATSLYGFKFREPDLRRERQSEDGSRQYDIKQLWQRSHEILNLALLGYKQTEIANILNITPQTVCNTLNSSLGKEVTAEKRETRDAEYDKLQEDVLVLTKKSLETYKKILENESENVKLQKETADTVVLELSGLRIPTRIDSRSMSVSLTSEEIAEFKKRGVKAARAAGKLIEVEGESRG